MTRVPSSVRALSARFLPRVSAWIESPYKAFSLGKRLASLVEHLAMGGEQPAAFALARILLRVVPRERSPESDSDPRRQSSYRVHISPGMMSQAVK